MVGIPYTKCFPITLPSKRYTSITSTDDIAAGIGKMLARKLSSIDYTIAIPAPSQ